MMKEDELKSHLEKLERFILGDEKKGSLPTQIIYCINSDEKIEIKIRRLLNWILTNKYTERK